MFRFSKAFLIFSLILIPVVSLFAQGVIPFPENSSFGNPISGNNSSSNSGIGIYQSPEPSEFVIPDSSSTKSNLGQTNSFPVKTSGLSLANSSLQTIQYLSDLTPSYQSGFLNGVVKDKPWWESYLSFLGYENNTSIAKGLILHPNNNSIGVAKWSLDRKFVRFQGVIGHAFQYNYLDIWELPDFANYSIQILLDGRSALGPYNPSGKGAWFFAVPFDLNVAGVQELEVIVNSNGPNWADHASIGGGELLSVPGYPSVPPASLTVGNIGFPTTPSHSDKTPSLPQKDPSPISCPTTPVKSLSSIPGGNLSTLLIADPVNIPSGNFAYYENDLSLKGRMGLTLTRVYNSIDTGISPFGRGWNSPYLSRLEIFATSTIFINSDGERVIFQNLGETFSAPSGVQLTLSLATDTGLWSVSQPDGNTWFFDSAGKILRMAESCCGRGISNTLTFDYNQTGLLYRVNNLAGQWFEFSYNSANKITSVADSTGRSVFYTYDENNNQISYKDVLGRITSYQYDEFGQIIHIEQPGNRVRVVSYENGRVSSVTTPGGETTLFNWDLLNFRVTISDPGSLTHIYQFSPSWNLCSYEVSGNGTEPVIKNYVASGPVLTNFTDSLGHQSSYSYYADGLLRSFTDQLENTYCYEWHQTLKKLTKKTDPLGREWKYTWCPRGNLRTETDPMGNVVSYTYDAFNNPVSKTDALGHVTRWIYDSTGNRLLQQIDAAGGISSFAYDLRGNLISSTDPISNTNLFEYDALDRLKKAIQPDGRYYTLEYDEAGNVSIRKDNINRETKYTYDSADRLINVTRPDGCILSYLYNSKGEKISETDPLGRVTRFEYSPVGLLTKTIYPDGSFETMSYDTENRLTSRTNELGQTTNLEYDAMGRLLCSVDPTGARWESQYDAAGRKTSDKDPLGRVTTYQLDSLDRVTKVIRPDNSFVTNTFDAVGNLLSTVDALGSQWSWVYDNLNRQVKAVQPNGASSTTTFDPAGQVIAETDALNRTTQYTFDNGGRRTATKDALGNIWQNVYDNAGRLIATKDPMGAVSSLTYDIMDRVISQSDPLGNLTSFEFDNAGRRVAKTDALGRRSITVFDLRDRVTSEVDPEGHTVSYGYNQAGQRLSLTDGANRTWRWELDSLGRVVREIDPLGNNNSYSFDSVGNRTSWTNARNHTTAYAFNAMNRLSQISYPDGTLATMSYDLEGRELVRSGTSGIVTKTWDSVGNMTSETFGPWGKKWQYSFDPVGNRVSAIDPEGRPFKYRFDQLNRLIQLDPPDRGDEIKFAFDPAGRPITEERPGVKTTNTFDQAGRLLEMRHERDHGREKIVASRRYQYNSVGNRISQTEENGEKTSYSFNNSDWLTKAVYPDGKQVSYSYNGAGDRIEERVETPTVKGHGRKKVIGTDTTVIPFSYDAGGRLVSRASDTFQFDNDGNQIAAVENGESSRYFWSPDNRLVKVEKDLTCDRHGIRHCKKCPQTLTLAESYGYLPNDWRRISRTTDDQQFFSVYENDDESSEYLVKESGHRFGWKCDKHKFCRCPAPKPEKKLELVRQFIGGPGTDDIVATRYHGRYLTTLKDALGSTIALTNRGGNPVARIGYDAWGNLKWPDKPGHGIKPCEDKDLPDWLDRLDLGRSFGFNFDPHHFGRHFARVLTPVLFASRRWDAFSQTYYNRNRQYVPKTGRFLNRDLIGFAGGPNLWAYPRNPVRFTDPFGLTSLEGIRAATDYLTQSGNAAARALAAEIGADPTNCDVTSAISDINDLLNRPILPSNEADNLRRALRALQWPFSDSNPTAASIRGESCESRATSIKNAIGGDIFVVDADPTGISTAMQNTLGDVRTNNGNLSGWSYHWVVIKDGLVYDRITGPSGEPLESYKSRFTSQPPLRFTPK